MIDRELLTEFTNVQIQYDAAIRSETVARDTKELRERKANTDELGRKVQEIRQRLADMFIR